MKKGASGKTGAPFILGAIEIVFGKKLTKMSLDISVRYNKVKFVILCMT
jgi:hypothetical protein